MADESQSPPRDEPVSPERAHARTRTDEMRPFVWLGHDKVIHLREWATDRAHALPDSDVRDCVIGSEESADIQLFDPRVLVSRRHAKLVRAGGGFWELKDLDSKNGIRAAGERVPRILVTPGLEIGIGSLTLVAENRTLVQLRAYLMRVLGWDDAQRTAVDLAMRAIRAAAALRAPLSLASPDDVVAVARQIHRHTAHADAPFIVCGRRPREIDASVRVTATHADPAASFALAAGGSVCVRAENSPARFEQLLDAARDPRAQAQLIICASMRSKRALVTSPRIVVPSLARRSTADVERIVTEYADEAIRELGASPTSFTDANRAWVVKRAADSFADIEITTLRLVARNEAGNVHQAAARLGLSHVALGDWFRRRDLFRP
jgi:FHA domain